ncbi:MAG TPA: T9SS type A sorting domain-containing protein, partial [Bacteroidetes bacterium]|nr:T9SS type A sorting domain-containing protein [Bacteroidota bacterium]
NDVFPGPGIPYNTVYPSGGKYIIHNLPKGLARVKYTVTDDCGNTTEKIIFVRVIDNLVPQAVCDEHTTISLNEDGRGYLGKITFDDGSYDNCSDVTFRVRRMTSSCDPSDTQWGDGIHFCCDDVSLTEPVMVQLEVTDAEGLKNSCMAQVFVQDKEKPKVFCPTSGEVSCKFDYSDLSVFGTVRTSIDDVEKIYIDDPEHGGNHKYFGKDGYATDNCNLTIEELPSRVNINNCGIGTILRRFRAQDDFGNRSTICTQIIKVIDFKPFDPKYDLIWPGDYTINGCLDESTDPDNLPVQYGWPIITGDDQCSMIAMDYDDLVFEHIDGMCYKIIRKWSVIDWCQYNQNDPLNTEGYWEHIQTLIINDNVDPQFTEGCTPSSLTALGDCKYRVEFNAVANDNCTPAEHLRYSYKVQINGDPNDLVTGEGSSFSTILSKGTHKITWYAEDNCGNIGQCSGTFTVKDEKPPTPQCLEGLVTVLLDETGEVTIHAADFNRNSTDDCTASNYGTCGCLTDLRFSFSSNVNERTRLLTCNDIENGSIDTIELEMWVTDESGNQDFCNTFIVLQDNADVCPDVIPPIDTNFYIVSGLITNSDNQPLSNIDLTLMSDNPEIPVSANTDENGSFAFTNLANIYNYSVKASREGDDINGLSTLDIVYIQKHLLGIKDLNSPYKLIAADVNNSGNISASDILELRKMILGEYDSFNNNHSWKFIPKDYKFENENDPFNFDPVVKLGNLTKDENIGFTGVKIGDINNSAITSSDQLENRNSDEIALIAEDISFSKGQEIEIPVFVTDQKELVGTQFTLKFNTSKLEYNGIANGLLSINKSNTNDNFKDRGLITLSWNTSEFINTNSASPLFKLKFIAKSDGRAKRNLDINSEITNAEIYINENDVIKENKLSLEFRNSVDANTFSVKQNVPNPFSETTTIGFEIPENQTVTISIYDITGKIVYQTRKEFEKGYNEIKINKKDINTTGLLYYKLEAGKYSAMKKMILIK